MRVRFERNESSGKEKITHFVLNLVNHLRSQNFFPLFELSSLDKTFMKFLNILMNMTENVEVTFDVFFVDTEFL